ncbi:inositol phosphate kinase 2 isoform X2 [Lycorma delicatula]|uniref:inositol phosphate kinase 2 isoform X2 n=1 Tax=Lycorma delicatula TaxID=130591 RepID=UPI003F50EA9A
MDGIENEGSSLTNSSGLMHSDFSEITKTCDSQDNGCEDSEYPINTKPLENQVAGHAFKDGKCTLGMLKHNDGYVLKPVNRPIQGEKEIKFYEELKKTVEPILLELKQFIPEYYGTTVLDLKGEKVTFLLLKDITNDFEEPCIMDIKVGKQTWEPGAPVEKQQSEQRKYAECKETLHFCIPGFQIYNIKTGLFQKYGKDFGKKLNPDGVYEGYIILKLIQLPLRSGTDMSSFNRHVY